MNGNDSGSVSNEASSQEPHDDSSTGTPSTTQNTSHSGTGRSAAVPEEIVATKENLAVNRSRRLFFGMLFLSTVIVGTLTWYWTRESERDDFETQVSRASHLCIN